MIIKSRPFADIRGVLMGSEDVILVRDAKMDAMDILELGIFQHLVLFNIELLGDYRDTFLNLIERLPEEGRVEKMFMNYPNLSLKGYVEYRRSIPETEIPDTIPKDIRDDFFYNIFVCGYTNWKDAERCEEIMKLKRGASSELSRAFKVAQKI